MYFHFHKKIPGINNQGFCTQSRDRTGTPVKELVFETSASTNSAIWAYEIGLRKYEIVLFEQNKFAINVFVSFKNVTDNPINNKTGKL